MAIAWQSHGNCATITTSDTAAITWTGTRAVGVSPTPSHGNCATITTSDTAAITWTGTRAAEVGPTPSHGKCATITTSDTAAKGGGAVAATITNAITKGTRGLEQVAGRFTVPK